MPLLVRTAFGCVLHDLLQLLEGGDRCRQRLELVPLLGRVERYLG